MATSGGNKFTFASTQGDTSGGPSGSKVPGRAHFVPVDDDLGIDDPMVYADLLRRGDPGTEEHDRGNGTPR